MVREKKAVRVSNSYALAEVIQACKLYEGVLAGRGLAELQEIARSDHGRAFFGKAQEMRKVGRGKMLVAELEEASDGNRG